MSKIIKTMEDYEIVNQIVNMKVVGCVNNKTNGIYIPLQVLFFCLLFPCIQQIY